MMSLQERPMAALSSCIGGFFQIVKLALSTVLSVEALGESSCHMNIQSSAPSENI